MVRRLVTALAFAIAALGFSQAASAATVDIVGGETKIAVTADLSAFTVGASPFSDFSDGVFTFGITGGEQNAGGLIIEHAFAGASLTLGTTTATIGNFTIDTAQSTIFGDVAFTPLSQVPLFELGPSNADGLQVLFSDALASTLASVFGIEALGDLAGTEFGRATTTPDLAPVPLPAAGWMLLAGLGGLVALRRWKAAA